MELGRGGFSGSMILNILSLSEPRSAPKNRSQNFDVMRVVEMIVDENINNLHATSSKALTTIAWAPNLLISLRTANTFSDESFPKMIRFASCPSNY